MSVFLGIGGEEGDSARELSRPQELQAVDTSVDPFQSVLVAAAISRGWKSFPKPWVATSGENFVSFKRGAVLHPECGWLWPEISKLSREVATSGSKSFQSRPLRRWIGQRGVALPSLYLSPCSLIAFSSSR